MILSDNLFIILRYSYQNDLGSHPYTTYLFIEKGVGYFGKRFYLRKTKENKEPLKKILPLIGICQPIIHDIRVLSIQVVD